MRARELGLTIGTGTPGPLNAITDVAGVRVGMTTLIEGEAVRTGVTVIVPPETPLFAGTHTLNGNGEMTGLEWLRDSGMLTTPIGITTTQSVGVVRDALIRCAPKDPDVWSLPVVAETWDGYLNEVNAMHVRAEHVVAAYEAASGGPVPEGNVGGGTGMICHGFKGGTGTASRILAKADGGYTVAVLVQANQGARERLAIEGVPVGRLIPASRVPTFEYSQPPGSGSIIVVVATDAPLLPGQCARLAQRAGLGIGRLGGAGENGSGDIFLCFSTGNRGLDDESTQITSVRMVGNGGLDPLFYAAIEATEEAIVNALVAAETMTGFSGNTAHALEPEALLEAMRLTR